MLLAAAGYFCLLCGYYMLRPLRDSLALEVGVRYNRWLFTAVLVCSVALLPIYWWLVGRTPRGRLLWIVAALFALVFVSLAVGLKMAPREPALAFAYFVALTTANFYIVSVFWSAMADVWRPELAKRFFGYVAAGGSLGALLGPPLVRLGIHELGPTPLIIFACAFILCSAPCVSAARRVLRSGVGGARVPDGAIPVGGRALDDLARLARTPYLLGIAGLLIAGQMIGAFMYSEQGKYVAASYSSLADRAALFATMEFCVNLLAFAFQGYITQTHIHPLSSSSAWSVASASHSSDDSGKRLPADNSKCPICQSAAHGQFITPSAAATLASPFSVSTIILAVEAQKLIETISHNWQGRAPPQV